MHHLPVLAEALAVSVVAGNTCGCPAQINGEQVDPLATIVHRDDAYRVGKGLTVRLKELIPRQQFKVPIQAAIGARVVASESISGTACIESDSCKELWRRAACALSPCLQRELSDSAGHVRQGPKLLTVVCRVCTKN